MAKRRKRRPAGPPPASSPKMKRLAEGTEKPKPQRRRRQVGEPRPVSFRGVLVRAFIIASLYFVLLIVVLRERPMIAAVVSLFGFALMVPLGMIFDRFRYRSQMKRWRARHGIPTPTEETVADTKHAEADDEATIAETDDAEIDKDRRA